MSRHIGLEGSSFGGYEGRKRGDLYITAHCDVWRVVVSSKRRDWQQSALVARFRDPADARAFVRFKQAVKGGRR